MAIKLEFFDLIVPIKTIKKKYQGGWKQCLKDHDSYIGGNRTQISSRILVTYHKTLQILVLNETLSYHI